MTCGCLEHHWQELAAFAFMGVGIAVPIYFVFKRFKKWLKKDDEIADKIMDELR